MSDMLSIQTRAQTTNFLRVLYDCASIPFAHA